MIKFIIIFTICSLVNVMLNTFKTIIMYKNERVSSALINAITYGFYTIIVVLMAGDMSLWVKVVVTAATNFVGVWLSMIIMEKLRKDKLWKVEATISKYQFEKNREILEMVKVPHNYIELKDDYIVNFYCSTQKQSIAVKTFLADCNAKYFVSESKTL